MKDVDYIEGKIIVREVKAIFFSSQYIAINYNKK